MGSPEFYNQLQQLESYEALLEANQALGLATNQVPREDNFNRGNRDHLMAQLAVLDAQDAVLARRQDLAFDVVARGRGFMPLPYQLGLIATLYKPSTDQQVEPLRLSRRRVTTLSDFGVDMLTERPVYPNPEPIGRAMQIGGLLTSMRAELDSTEPVPVAMVWKRQGSVMGRRNTVVAGIVTAPKKALPLTAPRVMQTQGNGEKRITYKLPTNLQGVGDLRVVEDRTEKNPTLTNDDYRKPGIPQLWRLLSKGWPAGMRDMYLGTSALERIAKAEQSEATRHAQEEAARNLPPAARRRRQAIDFRTRIR